jgi:hypothetical protein
LEVAAAEDTITDKLYSWCLNTVNMLKMNKNGALNEGSYPLWIGALLIVRRI